MSLMMICNEITYLCELIATKHFLKENHYIVSSSRVVTSNGTRIYPSSYAISRQIILCFNKKRVAQSIYDLYRYVLVSTGLYIDLLWCVCYRNIVGGPLLMLHT